MDMDFRCPFFILARKLSKKRPIVWEIYAFYYKV